MTDRRVLFFGDSFIAGVGCHDGLGWVGRVAAASFAAGLPLRHYNLGVGGHTSTQVARRWWAETRPRMEPAADMRVVFSFGANDATLLCGERRVSFEHSLANLDYVLDAAGEAGLSTYVVGPGPVNVAEQDHRIHGLDQAFAEETARRGTPYVSVHHALLADPEWTREAGDGDGVHPGPAGYAALAELVLEAGWCEWLAGPPPAS